MTVRRPKESSAVHPDAGRSQSRRGRVDLNYARMLVATGIGNVGDGVALVALPWYASTLTSNAVAVSAVAVAGRLPWLLFALLAGVVGDRVDRRRLLVGSISTKAAVLLGLVALIATDVRSVPAVIAIALVVGTCEVFFDNTMQSVVPRVVPSHLLERANGTLWGVEEAANRFVGPPLGGFLIGASLAVAFGVQAGLAVCVGLLLTTLHGDFRSRRAQPDEARPPIRVLLGEGLRWLWANRTMRTLAVVLGIVNAASAAPTAILVLFAREQLGLGSEGLGLALTAGAVGGIIGSQIAPRLGRFVPPGTVLSGVLTAQAVIYASIALFPFVAVWAVGTVLMSFASVWWNVVTVSFRQRQIPDELLSRVNAAYRTVGTGTLPLGALAGGGLVTIVEEVADRGTALRAPYLFAAVACLVLVPVTARRLTTRVLRPQDETVVAGDQP